MVITGVFRFLTAAAMLQMSVIASAQDAAAPQALSKSEWASAFIAAPGSSRPTPTLTTRLAPLADNEPTPGQLATIRKYAEQGQDGNALRTIARSPATAEEFFPLQVYVEAQSTLPSRDREVLILRTAWLTQNAYLWARHVRRGEAAGLSTAQVRAIAKGNGSPLQPRELMLIGVANELYRNGSLTDSTFAELKQAYDVAGTLDAVVTVTKMNETALVYNALGIAPDAGETARLPKDIAYSVPVPAREPPLHIARIDPVSSAENTTTLDLAISRTLARHPALAAAWYVRNDVIEKVPPLAPHDRELVVLRIGWNNQSEYEWAQHVGPVGRAREHGLDPRAIAIGAADPTWSARDRTLLAVADELYRDASISNATWQELRAIYDNQTLITVVRTAARYRRVSQTLNAIGVQKKIEEEPLPVFMRAAK